MVERIRLANIVVDNSINYQKMETMAGMASIGKSMQALIKRSMSQMEIYSYTTDNSEDSDTKEVKSAEEAIIYLAMENFSL